MAVVQDIDDFMDQMIDTVIMRVTFGGLTEGTAMVGEVNEAWLGEFIKYLRDKKKSNEFVTVNNPCEDEAFDIVPVEEISVSVFKNKSPEEIQPERASPIDKSSLEKEIMRNDSQ